MTKDQATCLSLHLPSSSSRSCKSSFLENSDKSISFFGIGMAVLPEDSLRKDWSVSHSVVQFIWSLHWPYRGWVRVRVWVEVRGEFRIRGSVRAKVGAEVGVRLWVCLKKKQGWIRSYPSHIQVGRGSDGDGHWGIRAGAVSSKCSKTPKKWNGDQPTKQPTDRRTDGQSGV